MKKFFPTHPSNCDKRCTGNETQFCGGSFRLNIYQNIREKIHPIETLVHITGSISTNEFFSNDIASKNSVIYKNFKNESKRDIETLLESNRLVIDAFVSIDTVIQAQNSQNALIEFIAVCKAR